MNLTTHQQFNSYILILIYIFALANFLILQSRCGKKRLLEFSEQNIPNFVAIIDGQVAGHLALIIDNHPRRRHIVSFGIGVGAEYSGKGVGKLLINTAIDYAFNWLAATRLELEVYSDNERGLHLYKKLGFEVEGVRRKAAFREGKYCDVVMMSMLRTIE